MNRCSALDTYAAHLRQLSQVPLLVLKALAQILLPGDLSSYCRDYLRCAIRSSATSLIKSCYHATSKKHKKSKVENLRNIMI